MEYYSDKNHQIMPFAAAWMELEIIILNKVSQKEKDKYYVLSLIWASQVPLVVKNPPANAGDIGDSGLIPGSRRFPGGGHGNPLQCFCLGNPMDRGARCATVNGVAKSWTQLSTQNTVQFSLPWGLSW